MTEMILIGVGLLGIATTLLPMLKTEVWWVRIFDFPRLQITFVLAGVVIFYLLFGWDSSLGENLFLFSLIACLGYQSFMMYPYTRLSRQQVEWSRAPNEEACISLVFSNVLIENRDAEKLLGVISESDPDIVLMVETDEWWHGKLQVLAKAYKYSVLQPQDNGYGMLLYSKLELLNPEVKFLIEDGIPSIHTSVTLSSGDRIVLRCLHPRPPFPTEDESSVGRDAELLVVGKEVKKLGEPTIVFGDLNDVSWSRTNYMFQNISGMLDPRVGRGFYHTFHAKYPFLRFPLDHFFHSNHFRLVELKRLRYFGSDHFPVYIRLSLEPDASKRQEELTADASEKKEANRKIARAVD